MTGNRHSYWRLGADLVVNSLGWAAIELDAPTDCKPIGIPAWASSNPH
ncbi:hypothetical protein J2W40_001147 [Sphingobium xenophagum]|uniref:Uncharacterized protein n=1 Tax=Sphingobium xenophagum TaxID=121428 RepID=A0ABU1WYE9_SPHXE|nr:hypothetical protein [Sphingobium xenophagum]MDR7154335.1 hypothetical protein [Sphingobium xenophagum]